VWGVVRFWDIAIVAIFTLFCVVLRRLDAEPDTSFKFHDLFTSGDWPGKASVSRLCYFGAFLAHSLLVLHQEMKQEKGVDYAMASLYALIWSGAYVLLKAIEARTPQPATTNGATNGPSSTQTNP
jgi:hypothetical protein